MGYIVFTRIITHPGLVDVYSFEVVRYKDVALEALRRLAGIFGSACGQRLVFGVVQQQVLHTQLGCHGSGVPGSAVKLLVGLEHFAVLIQAERLAHEPVGTARNRVVGPVARLVAHAHQRGSSRHYGMEAKLLFLVRKHVEALHADVSGLKFVAAQLLAQHDAAAEQRVIVLVQRHETYLL